MTISRRDAILVGIASIGVVLLAHAFNNYACYKNDFSAFLLTAAIFVLPPLVLAVVALALPNPLRAVGACAFLLPWLLLAFYTDCIRPYSGGGASMIYVAVLLWGFPSAIVGAFVAGPLARRWQIEVIER